MGLRRDQSDAPRYEVKRCVLQGSISCHVILQLANPLNDSFSLSNLFLYADCVFATCGKGGQRDTDLMVDPVDRVNDSCQDNRPSLHDCFVTMKAVRLLVIRSGSRMNSSCLPEAANPNVLRDMGPTLCENETNPDLSVGSYGGYGGSNISPLWNLVSGTKSSSGKAQAQSWTESRGGGDPRRR